jgi:hypothetical protein
LNMCRIPKAPPMNRPLPKWLRYSIIFAVAACIGSVAAYYIDPTGLMCGVLAVLIFRQAEGGRS